MFSDSVGALTWEELFVVSGDGGVTGISLESKKGVPLSKPGSSAFSVAVVSSELTVAVVSEIGRASCRERVFADV
jgi:hypothetical protein